MIEALASILIVLIIAAGAYYASYRYVELRHNRDTIADEFKRATAYIAEMEERVMLLEAQLDTQRSNIPKATGSSNGWSEMNIRS